VAGTAVVMIFRVHPPGYRERDDPRHLVDHQDFLRCLRNKDLSSFEYMSKTRTGQINDVMQTVLGFAASRGTAEFDDGRMRRRS
jgi:hypothetical protein